MSIPYFFLNTTIRQLIAQQYHSVRGLTEKVACRYHYRRDTAHYTSFPHEVNTGALLRKTLVLLILTNSGISPKMLNSSVIIECVTSFVQSIPDASLLCTFLPRRLYRELSERYAEIKSLSFCGNGERYIPLCEYLRIS